MSSPLLPAVLDHRPIGAALPVYLGLYLVLLAFFVYFVAAAAGDRRTQVAVADDGIAGIAQPMQPLAVTAPALRPLAEVFRPLALPAAPGDGSEPRRLDAAVSPNRLFTEDTATLRPELAPVLDQVARALTAPALAASPNAAGGLPEDESLDLQLLIALPAAIGTDAEPASVADIVAERLAVARAAALARALLARGTPPETFAVGVALGTGKAVHFVFHLDRPHAASPRRD